MNQWTVGKVAEEFGLTVRTLHHYDEIGLLVPSERSYAGYRLYTERDVERLATVVVYRRLGFSLDDIATLLAGNGSVAEHLRRQRASVIAKVTELRDLVAAIDNALEREMNNRPATPSELKELFGEGFSDEYRAQAEQEWGQSAAWSQAQQRTANFTIEDWTTIKAEADAINDSFVHALTSGQPATSEAARNAAEAQRVHIETWYYECDLAFHRCLGQFYSSNPEQVGVYEKLAPGLATYVRDAINANADRRG